MDVDFVRERVGILCESKDRRSSNSEPPAVAHTLLRCFDTSTRFNLIALDAKGDIEPDGSDGAFKRIAAYIQRLTHSQCSP